MVLSLEAFEAGQGRRHLDWTKGGARGKPTRPCLRRTAIVKYAGEHARGKREKTGDGMHGQGIIIAHGAVTAPKLGTRLDTGHGRG